MPKKIEEKIHILSPYRGYLAPANVMGPIVHPLCVDKSVVAKILMSGADVYEYIPHSKKTLKLTLSNFNNPNRYTELDEKVEEVAPVTVAPVIMTGVSTDAETNDNAEVEPEQKQDEVTSNDVADNENAEETDDEESHDTEPSTETQVPATKFEFEYNEDGTVDETKIEWSNYSKNQRKEIRAQINQHNASLTN